MARKQEHKLPYGELPHQQPLRTKHLQSINLQVVPGDVMLVNITQTGNNNKNASLTGWTPVAGRRQSNGNRYSTVLYRWLMALKGHLFHFHLGTASPGQLDQ